MPDTYSVATLATSGLTSTAFSADGARIYAARADGTIDVFDVASRTKIATWDIGTRLGGLSVSEDGSFLLVVEQAVNLSPPYPTTFSTLYRVDTTTGNFTTYTQPGSLYLDVEIVDGDTAILTGGQPQVTRLNLTTGTFSTVANAISYANGSVMVEDEHLTLLAEGGISSGPLFLYDDRTDTIVAQGDNYQTMGAGSGSIGSNFGHQALSETAGLVAQFAYHSTINIFDLTLTYLRDLDLPGSVDGLAFDPTGTYLFARLTTGPLMQYNVATGALVASYELDPTEWHNNAGAADQITFSDDGTLIVVHDNSTGKLQIIDLEDHAEQHAGTVGADAFAGGRGDDTYVVNNAGDTISEQQYEGTDTALAGVSFTLPVYVENLDLTGTAANGTGNQLANVIRGNAAANLVTGNGGADTLSGAGGNDTLVGGTGNDTLLGEAGNDNLWGDNGDDVLDGGAGSDTLKGGNGDDTATVAGGTTSADTGTEVVDLGYATPDGSPQTYGEEGKDHLIVNYGSITQDVFFHGISSDAGPGFGPIGAEAVADIGGARRLTFYGVNKLTVTTGSGNDTVYSVSTYDVISTGAGNDVIYGYAALAGRPVRIDGGAGIDRVNTVDWGDLGTAVVLDVNNPVGVTIGSGAEERYLRGIESLYGFTTGSGDDVIMLHSSGAQQNVIDTGTGGDTVTVYGGTTSATTAYNSLNLGYGPAADHLIANFASATQKVVYEADGGGGGHTSIGGVQQHNYSNVEIVTVITGQANDVVDGRNAYNATHEFSTGAGTDTLYGASGNDRLDGGAGNDAMTGGNGDDWYYVDSAGDVVTEGAAQGANDRILANASYTLGAAVYVERLTTRDDAATVAINLTGNAFANTIEGNAGANTLDGKAGADTLIGRGGDDFYFVDNASDAITEGAGEGALDRIFASVSYTMAAGVQVERMSTNNNAGTAAINLTGNEFANMIYGNAGANVLDGKVGADVLVGLGGDDLYYVDSAGDALVEGVADGALDRVIASVSYTLGAGVYVERLLTNDDNGTAAINFTGNELANQLHGNAGSNVLNGKGGADVLVGLGGDDLYYVDSAADVVSETAGNGTDRIYASVSYTQGAGVQVEQLLTIDNNGTAAINLTGNELANVIYGNAGNNVLDGRGGADLLAGLGGDDVYFVDNATDAISETAGNGTDRISASVSYTQGAGVQVERLTTDNNAGTGAINLTGNELANLIYGNAGANVLDGKAGADTLVGLDGADTFAFTTALGPGNVDAVSGFVVADDTILLENAVFTGLATGVLSAGAFATGSAATQADDRVIYNSATGALLFDADGSGAGAAVQFAMLTAGLALTSADFLVV